MRRMWTRHLILVGLIVLASLLAQVGTAYADIRTARPSEAGQLHVSGTKLRDEQGDIAVLRGVSTHGLHWYDEYVNEPLFSQLSEEWDANIVRLALYAEHYSNTKDPAVLDTMRRGIDAAIASDMYVLVDWHMLEEEDPNVHLEEAKAFFETISSEYAGVPNVLYEICNEPNGGTTWADIRTFAEQVIPIIRSHSPKAVVVVGTPVYDTELMMASRAPIDDDNVAYTLHFYAATHDEDLKGELLAALDAGLPVFITECGISEATGDGRIDYENAADWFTLLDEHDISFVVWSLSNKAESSAFIRSRSEATTHLADEDLSASGLWIRALLQGEDPAQISISGRLNDEGKLVEDDNPLLRSLSARDIHSARTWPLFAVAAAVLVILTLLAATLHARAHPTPSYDTLVGDSMPSRGQAGIVTRILILLSSLLTLIYLLWRMSFSLPLKAGPLAICANVVLLSVELLGFVESLVHYSALMRLREHPLPTIEDDDYPEVDVFIATYNESCDLLARTINGCQHLRYPDTSKVHIWVCDDNRRPEMRALADSMGVGYFDRPDNSGAKAGNLNAALARTSAPYVVTLDADMIVRSDFLLKTIPYFVDAERHSTEMPEEDRVHLGLLQTPQAFYTPDVFQHALFAEHRATNEQDYFYRSVEPAKTSSNSVIYGGSNTVISRAALEAVGGFFTESITEDFATGILIESAGFVSLAIPEPLASGQTPATFREHVKQRQRWGRGVIAAARQLHYLSRPGFSLEQRISYWGSVVYWYSPIKSLIYVTAPLLYAAFGLPVFACSWLDLFQYWLPMFVAQTLCLRAMSGNSISTRWSGIHETSVMPFLLLPVVQELLGITLSTFKVTDKSGGSRRRSTDWRAMLPFLVLLALSAFAVVRVVTLVRVDQHAVGLAVLLFWLFRNAYYLVMALFLIDGRDRDDEPVRVIGAELVQVEAPLADGVTKRFDGVATTLTEHSIRAYLDDAGDLKLGTRVEVSLDTGLYHVEMGGIVVELRRSRHGTTVVHTIEILDEREYHDEYLQILYDRVPSLPQVLGNDHGSLVHLWRNIALHVARGVES